MKNIKKIFNKNLFLQIFLLFSITLVAYGATINDFTQSIVKDDIISSAWYNKVNTVLGGEKIDGSICNFSGGKINCLLSNTAAAPTSGGATTPTTTSGWTPYSSGNFKPDCQYRAKIYDSTNGNGTLNSLLVNSANIYWGFDDFQPKFAYTNNTQKLYIKLTGYNNPTYTETNGVTVLYKKAFTDNTAFSGNDVVSPGTNIDLTTAKYYLEWRGNGSTENIFVPLGPVTVDKVTLNKAYIIDLPLTNGFLYTNTNDTKVYSTVVGSPNHGRTTTSIEYKCN